MPAPSAALFCGSENFDEHYFNLRHSKTKPQQLNNAIRSCEQSPVEYIVVVLWL
jgi:hypothetical protein